MERVTRDLYEWMRGPHGGCDSHKYHVVGCGAVYSDRHLPVFLKNILPSFLRIEASSKQSALLAACFFVVSSLVYSPTLNMETVYSSEASVHFYQPTRHQIPEDSPIFLKATNIYMHAQFYKDTAKSNRIPVNMKRARHRMFSETWLASRESWYVDD